MLFKNKLMWLTSAICLLPIIYGGAMYMQLPSQIPTRWGSNGVSDYVSKEIFLFVYPFVLAFGNMVIHLVLNRPKTRVNPKHMFTYLYKWTFPIMVNVLCVTSILKAKGIL
ncbi:MAG: DUF1648 domain-containing protein [Alcaligenaceae bacterium]|nr:DUF1648 domain-containing protein [Alcaligenaceae bacterium]